MTKKKQGTPKSIQQTKVKKEKTVFKLTGEQITTYVKVRTEIEKAQGTYTFLATKHRESILQGFMQQLGMDVSKQWRFDENTFEFHKGLPPQNPIVPPIPPPEEEEK